MEQPSDIRKVAFLGDYLPRKCGIATFTTDVRCAVAKEFPQLPCLVVPVLALLWDEPPGQLPELKLDHLFRMSYSTGIFQHASYTVPNFAEGYCPDDNSPWHFCPRFRRCRCCKIHSPVSRNPTVDSCYRRRSKLQN